MPKRRKEIPGQDDMIADLQRQETERKFQEWWAGLGFSAVAKEAEPSETPVSQPPKTNDEAH